jgi:dTDP-4-amino-4,6-dideoxygalactose transaminase
MQDAVLRIEESGIYANNGPTVQLFENRMTELLFGGEGGIVTTANATLGLVLAIKQAAGASPGRGSLALMPSFTFAATAHAAIWAGLKPLLCDIDETSWIPSPLAEEAALKRHGGAIAVIVPYAAFGAALDLGRYAWLSRKYDVGVVVDAASSLGSLGDDGRNFGAGQRFALVYSMHATKTFASGEGGVIYSADRQRLAGLRRMASFGFGHHPGQARAAIMPGLNAKLTEIGALLALGKLAEIDTIVAKREALAALYRSELEGFTFQAPTLSQQALQFMPILLPARLAPERARIVARLADQGIGTGTYFSPHLKEQPYFARCGVAGSLAVTDTIASRILALPLADMMTADEVLRVAKALREACFTSLPEGAAAASWPGVLHQAAQALPGSAALPRVA